MTLLCADVAFDASNANMGQERRRLIGLQSDKGKWEREKREGEGGESEREKKEKAEKERGE